MDAEVAKRLSSAKVKDKNNSFGFGATSHSQQFPAGVKYHMYKDVLNDLEMNKKNHWSSLFNMIGAKAGQDQNIITEIVNNYRGQEAQMERIMTKFTRGECIEARDMKDDPSDDPAIRNNVNFSAAMRDVGRQSTVGVNAALKRARFSNLRNTAVSMHRVPGSKQVEPGTVGSRRSQHTVKSVSDMPRIFLNEKEIC